MFVFKVEFWRIWDKFFLFEDSEVLLVYLMFCFLGVVLLGKLFPEFGFQKLFELLMMF